MYIPDSYLAAVVMMFITMICWGSWANTQKLAKGWRFELYYWDYAIGVLVMSAVFGFTLGSFGSSGTPFFEDIGQSDLSHITSAFLGGVIFNIANILLVAAIAIAGMAVAFPIGIGIALVEGTLINYIFSPQGNALLLFLGVTLVLAAIILDALAYRRIPSGAGGGTNKGFIVSVIAGILMGLFYFLVARSMEGPQSLGSYSAVFFFSVGLFICNIPVNYIFMKKPISGTPVSMSEYFKGGSKVHLIGILGGLIWCVGMAFNIVASTKAGPAIAYAFGQGATMIAAIWGVFVWKEFKEAQSVTGLLVFMFLCYALGLVFIGAANLI